MPLLPPDVAELCRAQTGVVSRAQLLACGAGGVQVRSWLRHRLLVRIHPGVYVDHTGRPTPDQLAWAAVLWASPAALFGPSALLAAGLGRGGTVGAPVTVLVAAERKLTPPPGVRLRRTRCLDDSVEWHRRPPRQRLEEAALDVASSARDEHAAIAVLADAVSSRRTTPARLREALGRRTRLPRRAFLCAVLDDVASGACSVLERAYLRRVERAHGLPTGDRQVRSSARGTVYRDVEYRAFGVVVELDGRLDHEHAGDRERDLTRDVVAAAQGLLTLRLWWGQVVGDECRTADAIAEVLRARGWTGTPRRCPRCLDRGRSVSPRSTDQPRSRTP